MGMLFGACQTDAQTSREATQASDDVVRVAEVFETSRDEGSALGQPRRSE